MNKYRKIIDKQSDLKAWSLVSSEDILALSMSCKTNLKVVIDDICSSQVTSFYLLGFH
jgi:hypothetical protein